MLKSQQFQVPYFDPYGYDIVSPQGLQVMAEAVDSITTDRFDPVYDRLRRKSSVFVGTNGTNGPTWTGGFPDGAGWVSTVKSKTSPPNGSPEVYEGGAGTFSYSPGASGKAGYVLIGANLTIKAAGTADINSHRYVRLENTKSVNGYSQTTQLLEQWSYESGTGGECIFIQGVFRMERGSSVWVRWGHGNTSSGCYITSNSWRWATFLCEAS